MIMIMMNVLGFVLGDVATSVLEDTTTTRHRMLQSSDCSLNCPVGIGCVYGPLPNYLSSSIHPVDPYTGEPLVSAAAAEEYPNEDGWYCQCQNEESFGLECEHHYKTCKDTPHVCYNGGECIDGLTEMGVQDHELYCNCVPQISKDPYTGESYARRYSGKYCETEIPGKGSTTTTTNPTSNNYMHCSQNPTEYCKNNGTCNNDEHTMFVSPCICPLGRVGKHCEYETHTAPNCDLPCNNGGQCRLGSGFGTTTATNPWVSAALSHGNSTSQKPMHCECPYEFTGPLCEHKKEDTCGTNFVCEHGARCIQKGDNYFCDCRSIMKTNTNTNDDPYFAGRHCEYRSTSICEQGLLPSSSLSTITTTTIQIHSTIRFCTNNGTCPMSTTTPSNHHPCECSNGYGGPHCEYSPDDIVAQKEYTKCNLDCANGGTCMKGSSQHSANNMDVQSFENHPDIAHLNLSSISTSISNFEYCLCPIGFVGHLCELEHDSCDEGGVIVAGQPNNDEEEHLGCFHGSECKQVNGKPQCDCDTTTNNIPAVGKYCQHTNQHPKSVICKDNNNAKKDSSSSSSSFTTTSGFTPPSNTNNNNKKQYFKGFCANGGKCIQDPMDITGSSQTCSCPSGYSGIHCEYLATTLSGSLASSSTQQEDSSGSSSNSIGKENYTTNKNRTTWISIILILATVSFVMFGIKQYSRRQYRKENHNVDRNMDNYSDHHAGRNMTTRDADGLVVEDLHLENDDEEEEDDDEGQEERTCANVEMVTQQKPHHYAQSSNIAPARELV